MVSTSHLLIVLGVCCPTIAFSTFTSSSIGSASIYHRVKRGPGFGFIKKKPWGPLVSVRQLRGGADVVAQEETVASDAAAATESVAAVVQEEIPETPPQEETVATSSKAMVLAPLLSLGQVYAKSLEQRPILTKSVTAGFIFTLSDWLAQVLEKSSSSDNDDKDKKPTTNWTRAVSAGLVGLLYFGPAAHAWYETIFRLLPGTSLVSTLQKAALGQLLFGPSFTCIFFAVSLLQAGTFTLPHWWAKIRSDLPGAWAAGLGFWPLVDLVSYSSVPKDYIPLFVNACSLVWTIYLSLVANRSNNNTSASDKKKKGKK